MPTQMGSDIWKGFTPGNDARIVNYLRKNGALILGKTTTAEFAVHHQHKTKNPHDHQRSPGTSSGGSAVAVASNMVPVAFGSQTGGSIIRPASYCGVYGYKPTFGLLPRIGVLKTTDSLDTLGFFTKSARDLKLMLDSSRVHGRNYEYVHQYLDNYRPTNKKLKIGILQHPKWDFANNFAKERFNTFIKKINTVDFDIEQMPMPSEIMDIYTLHGTIYDKTLAYYFKKEATKTDLLSSKFKAILKNGNTISTQEYKNALQQQAYKTIEFKNKYKDYDILLTLATADEAPLGISSEDLPDSNLIWTFLGMPVVSIPALKGENDLPIGVLAIAHKYDDYKLLEFINEIEKVLDERYTK